jgi:ribosome-associated toxin RatA of RatAB toxin-antitoxin module
MSMVRFCALAAAASLLSAPALSAADVQIETYRQGDAVTVWAEAELQVDPRIAWDVLCDYDHMSSFIPDLSASKVVSRNANTLVVEQKGEFAFLFFRQPVEVRMETVETPQSRIVAHAISGSFREMSGRYDLQKIGEAGIRITYTGRFVPGFSLPPFFGIVAVRHTAAKQFTAMVEEIQRRDALAAHGAAR